MRQIRFETPSAPAISIASLWLGVVFWPIALMRPIASWNSFSVSFTSRTKACRCRTREERISFVRGSGVRCISPSTASVTSFSLRMTMPELPPEEGKSSSAAALATGVGLALRVAVCVAARLAIRMAARLRNGFAAHFLPDLRRSAAVALLDLTLHAFRLALHVAREAIGRRHLLLVLLHDRAALRFRHAHRRSRLGARARVR